MLGSFSTWKVNQIAGEAGSGVSRKRHVKYADIGHVLCSLGPPLMKPKQEPRCWVGPQTLLRPDHFSLPQKTVSCGSTSYMAPRGSECNVEQVGKMRCWLCWKAVEMELTMCKVVLQGSHRKACVQAWHLGHHDMQHTCGPNAHTTTRWGVKNPTLTLGSLKFCDPG